MSVLSRNLTLALAAAAVFLLTAALYVFGVSPQRSRAGELDERVAQRRLQLVQARSGGAREDAVSVAESFRLAKAMPDASDMAGMLVLISSLARGTGVAFESITPGAAVASTGYQVLPVSVVLQGTFYDLSDFLYRLRNLVRVSGGRLETGGRLFTVESLSLVKGTKGFPRLQATVMLNAYVYGAGGATPPPGAPSPATGTLSTGGAQAVGATR